MAVENTRGIAAKSHSLHRLVRLRVCICGEEPMKWGTEKMIGYGCDGCEFFTGLYHSEGNARRAWNKAIKSA